MYADSGQNLLQPENIHPRRIESIMQSCLTNPKITVVSYGVVEKIDQFGNPWEEWMDRFAIMPTMMPATAPISSDTNQFVGQAIREQTPMQIAEWERRKKEWENSPYANNEGIDNAVLFAEMLEFERDALAESVREELRETYEMELEKAVTAITRDSSESLKTALWSGVDVLTLGLMNLFDPNKAKQLKLLRSKHWLAGMIGDVGGLMISSGALNGFKGDGGAGGKYSAFGEMSDADGVRYNRYWDDVVKGLNTDTRVKLNQWQFRPDADLYNKYKAVYDNSKYFDQLTGNVKYPGEYGDVNINGFTKGAHVREVLQPGTVIDRYGSNGTGKFFSPEGTPYGERALPPFMEN